jgi:hypothetical protein
VNKKKVKNAAKVVDDVRYDGLGTAQHRLRKSKCVNCVLKPIQG